MSTNRFWCFTLNNPDGLLDCDFADWINNGLRYAVYQHEVGEQGTEHFQGYLELDRGQRLSYVGARIPGAHFEPRRGTQAEAIAYCKKEDSRLDGPWEFGTPSEGQGARADIKAFKEAIDRGATDVELWDSLPNQYMRYSRIIPQLRGLKQAKRSWKTEVTLCYGPPGSGKTFWIRSQAPDAWWKQPNSKWFDGYTGEPDVVLDDFKAWLPWANLLQLLDAYPLTVETKGGQVNWIPRRVFISTNWLPCDWYTDDKYPLRALIRRIEKFVLFQERSFEELVADGPIKEEFVDYDSFIQATVNFH